MATLLSQATVLLIEVDANDQLVTQRLLQLSGVKHVIARHNLAETLETLDSHVDLILLDLKCEDCRLLLPAMRAHDHFQASVIVALAASITPQTLSQARAMELNGFLSKPVNFEKFAEQLQQLLNGESIWQMR